MGDTSVPGGVGGDTGRQGAGAGTAVTHRLSLAGFGTSTRSHFTYAMTSWWPGTCKGPTPPSKVRWGHGAGGHTRTHACRVRPDGPLCVCVSPERVFWVPNRAFEPARLPIILGIQNGTRCLASPPASQPTLQLQVRGHRGDGDTKGMGMPWGRGRHGDGDAMGTGTPKG